LDKAGKEKWLACAKYPPWALDRATRNLVEDLRGERKPGRCLRPPQRLWRGSAKVSRKNRRGEMAGACRRALARPWQGCHKPWRRLAKGRGESPGGEKTAGICKKADALERACERLLTERREEMAGHMPERPEEALEKARERP
jgi:hypothetical protein